MWTTVALSTTTRPDISSGSKWGDKDFRDFSLDLVGHPIRPLPEKFYLAVFYPNIGKIFRESDEYSSTTDQQYWMLFEKIKKTRIVWKQIFP